MSKTERPSNAELLARARDRIQTHRKSDLTVEVLNGDGKPARGVRVEVRMQRHKFLFGIALFEALADKDEQFCRPRAMKALDHWDDLRSRARDLFNFGTLPVYWGRYEPQPGETNAQKVKHLHEWCVEGGWKTKAYPLVWCSGPPPWLPDDPREIERLIGERMERLVTDFGPGSDHPLDFVDFINEPTVQPENFDHALARWMQTIGADASVQMAYQACRGYDLPRCGIINHFMRDEEFLGVCRRLTEGGRPLRAVGLQSHQHSGTRPLWMFQEETDLFAETLGLPVHWTENSILSGENRRIRFVQGKAEVPPWPSTPEGEERQERALAEQYTLLFGHPKVEALTQWNFTDATAWLGAPSGLLDEDLQPKPAYRALHELIRGQWWSEVDLDTKSDGCATERVFKGDYRVRALGAKGPAPWTEHAVADTSSQITIRLP